MIISKEDRLLLREGVKEAYFNATGTRLFISNTKTNEYYKSLRKVIRKELNLDPSRAVPGVGALRDFFFVEEHLSFYPATIKIFNDFINTCKPITRVKSEEISDSEPIRQKWDGINLKGAYFVDSSFKKRMLANDFIPQKTDFYLAKNENDCQWRGIVRSWDYPRRERDIVKTNVLNSFNWQSKFAAVIYGSGGCGKSTFLRRLAIDCINEKLRILWINNLQDFCNDDLKSIGHTPEKFLCILEDWQLIKDNQLLISAFLNRVLESHNVRIVIGDRGPIQQKEYCRYLLEGGDFELSHDENDKIIQKVLGLNDIWKESAEKVFTSKEIYNAPIYLILFLLARDAGGNEHKDTKDALSLFRNIIVDDQTRIHKASPGLAKALYYWSCILKKYSDRANIAWEAFLKIADSFDTNDTNSNASSRFGVLRRNDPISEILLSYISVERILDPHQSHNHFFRFHHYLLVDQGLSVPIMEEWFFNEQIMAHMLSTLADKNEPESVRNLIYLLAEDEKIKDLAVKQIGLEEFTAINHIFVTKIYHEMIKGFYANASVITDESYWYNTLDRLLRNSLAVPYFTSEQIRDILKNIIDKGCRSTFITSAYNILSSQGLEFVWNLLKEEDKQKIVDFGLIRDALPNYGFQKSSPDMPAPISKHLEHKNELLAKSPKYVTMFRSLRNKLSHLATRFRMRN